MDLDRQIDVTLGYMQRAKTKYVLWEPQCEKGDMLFVWDFDRIFFVVVLDVVLKTSSTKQKSGLYWKCEVKSIAQRW